jgi:hypothetical protein
MWDALAQTFSESFQRLAFTAARHLPHVVAMLVFAAVSLALAWGAGRVAGRVLTAIQLDRHLRRWSPPGDRGAPGYSPTAIARGFVFWLTLAVGLVLSLTSVESRWTSTFADHVLAYVPSVVAAGLIFAVAIALSRYVEGSVLVSAVNMQLRFARLLATGARWLVAVFGTAMALQHLGVGGALVTISFSILFGGIVLALALAVGLGSREAVTRSLDRKLGEDKRPEPPRIAHL